MMHTRPTRGAASAAIALTGLVALTACTPTPATSEAPEVSQSAEPAQSGSEAGWNEQLIDGPANPEDLIQLSSGTVIVSGMSSDPGDDAGAAGSLYTMNPATDSLTELWPDAEHEIDHDQDRYAECPGAPNTAIASPHGLGAETAEDGTEYLYVVNHGGRESVEVFEVENSSQDTQLTWVGCSVLPDGSFGNGVVADPLSEGFYVTHFLDPTDMAGEFELAFAGESTGDVRHWTSNGGWGTVPGSEMSTPNGIAVSEDGSTLYVASWGGRELVEIDPESGERTATAPLEFMPDNLRPTDDGTVLVTGQVIDSLETFQQYESGEREPEERYDIYRLSPDTFEVEPVAHGEIGGFGNPTTALEVEDEILVGSVAGTKILRLDRQ